MYTSLADYQIKREEYFEKNPLIMNENDVEQTPAEILYQVCKLCFIKYTT